MGRAFTAKAGKATIEVGLPALEGTLQLATVVRMENKNDGERAGPTLHELYPHLDDNQLKGIEENLEQYLAFTVRLYKRICEDPEAYAHFKALTALDATPTISVERSSQNQSTH